MKKFLFIIFLFSVSKIKADTFYFSSVSGNDERSAKQAQNANTPWKTIDRLNEYFDKLKGGDVVLFKSGETFFGSLKISEKDNKKLRSKPITIGSYGGSTKPIITGLQTITGWKFIGNGIYEKQLTSFPDTLNMVLIGGELQPMGRWPKVSDANNGYLTYQSHRGTVSIKSDAISAAKSFVGGEIVIRKELWLLDRGKVTAQSTDTIGYSPFISPGHPRTTYQPANGYGFFFQNHVNTLTSQGDWCFDPSSKKIKMYFGGIDPTGVRIPLVESIIDMTHEDNIIFDNLSFVGANSNMINITHCSNIQINNCELEFSGVNAIHVVGGYYNQPKGNSEKLSGDSSRNIKLTNSCITNTQNNAIDGGNAHNWLIQDNIIRNTGMVRGMGASGDGQYNAISYVSTNSIVEYNTIINTGYIGIHFIGSNTVIKNNYIDHFCTIKSDGGGIYTYGETGSNRKVTGNIISNGKGDVYGTKGNANNPFSGQVHGIYMDGNSNNVTIENNSSFNNSHSGLFLGSSTNMVVKNNTLYNNAVAQLKGIDSKGMLTNIKINNNTLVARDSAQLIISLVLAQKYFQGSYNIGSVDNNYYCRPLYEPQAIKTQGYPNGTSFYNYPGGGIAEAWDGNFYSLDTWRSVKGWDMNTKKSPEAIDNLDNLRFEFNPTNTPKAIALDGVYIDMTNKSYANSVTLAPFTSVVLIRKHQETNQTYLAANRIKIEIENNRSEPVITAFPIPSKTTISIRVMPVESVYATIELLDQQGRPVKNLFTGFVKTGIPKTFNLNLGSLSKGLYIIRFVSKGSITTKQISVM